MEAFKLGTLIRGTTKNIKKHVNDRLKPYNLSEGHFEYFIHIYKHQGLNQKELAERMNLGKAGVTKAVQRLMSEDLIYRKIRESDQRNYGLYITEKGQGYVKLFHEISDELSTAVLNNFTDEELELLFKLMNKLYKNTQTL